MATPAPQFVTVIHLEKTGHVLAAVSSGGLVPKLEELVGPNGLRVRFPGGALFVNVPADVLKATRVAISADVLDRPQYYVVNDGVLSFGAGPKMTTTITAGAESTPVVIVWWVASPVPGHAEHFTGKLGAGGALPGKPPTAQTQLLAYVGGPLYLSWPVP
jgi:hypothetical protein